MSKSDQGPPNAIRRIEVYVDDATTPTKVLTSPPFHIEVDTASLADGPHTLRVVQTFEDGARSERVVPFVTENHPPLEVEGIEPGAVVRGRLAVDLVTPSVTAGGSEQEPSPDAPPSAGGPTNWWYPIIAAIVFGGVWLFFLLVPTYTLFVPSGDGEEAAPAVEVDAAVMAEGESVYSAICSVCHQADGTGMGTAIPGLAGNAVLADVDATLTSIMENDGHPESVDALTAEELAGVATYVRNSWGNAYGPVSVDEASTMVSADAAPMEEDAAEEPAEEEAAEEPMDEDAAEEPMDEEAAEEPMDEEEAAEEPMDEEAAEEPAEEEAAAAGGHLFVTDGSPEFISDDGTTLGNLELATRLNVLADDGDTVGFELQGWSMETGPTVVFFSRVQRIPTARLTDAGLEAREIVDSVEDDFGTVWEQVRIEGTVPSDNLANDRENLWQAGQEVNNSACGGCHSVHPPEDYTANQWPGVIDSMVPSYVSMTDEEITLLTKYVQYDAKDMEQ